MKIKPRPGRLYVILDEMVDQKLGKIIIQANSRHLSRNGVVQSVGAGVDKDLVDKGILEPGMTLKPGDKVLVSCVGGIIVDDPMLWNESRADDPFRIFTPQEILATLEE